MISGDNFVISYNTDLELYHKKYSGTVTIEDILYHVSLSDKWNLPRDLRIIEDLRNAKLVDVSLSGLPKLIEAVEKTMLKYNTVKMAFLHNDPTGLAYTITFVNRTSHLKNLLTKTFMTFDGAVDWLCKDPYVILRS